MSAAQRPDADVKVCGVTRPEDATLACELGADLLGLNFCAAHARARSRWRRRARCADAARGRALLVGVFVNERPATRSRRRSRRVGLDLVQLHGDEEPELLGELARAGVAPGKTIRAFRVGAAFDRGRELRAARERAGASCSTPRARACTAAPARSGPGAASPARYRPARPQAPRAACWSPAASHRRPNVRAAVRRPGLRVAGDWRRVGLAALGDRRLLGRGERARPQGRGEAARACSRRSRDVEIADAGLTPRPLRPVRRALRPRDADGAARRAGAGLRQARAAPPLPRASSTSCSPTTPAGRRRSTSPPAADRRARRRAHLPQARGPAAHRRAQDQQRPRPGAARRGAWARSGSSPRPAPASTASPPPPPRRCSGSSAWSTWATRTCAASGSTSTACACSAPRWCRSTPAAARSRTPSTRRCATGSPTCAPPTTSSARCSARIRTRGWCATSTASSARRRGASSSARTGRADARSRHRLRRRRQQRHRPVLAPSSTTARVRLIGVEAGGRGSGLGEHAARFAAAAALGVLHGTRTHAAAGRRRPDRDHALGLGRPRLPGGRPRARAARRAAGASSTPRSRTPRRSTAFHQLAQTEGILPALESAHALAEAIAPRAATSASAWWCWSTSPAAATRTSSRCSSGTPAHATAGARPARRLLQPVPHGARQPLDEPASTSSALHRGGKRSSAIAEAFARCRRRSAPPSSPSSWPATPTSRRRRACSRRWPAGGADIVELGVPFSDPIADGPVNQRAAARALAAGTTLDDVLRMVARHRDASGRADRALHLLQPAPRTRPRHASPSRPPPPASTACCASTCRPRKRRRSCCRRSTSTASTASSCSRRPARRERVKRVAASVERLRLLRLAHRSHRRARRAAARPRRAR